jgi:hypothetical protein
MRSVATAKSLTYMAGRPPSNFPSAHCRVRLIAKHELLVALTSGQVILGVNEDS